MHFWGRRGGTSSLSEADSSEEAANSTSLPSPPGPRLFSTFCTKMTDGVPNPRMSPSLEEINHEHKFVLYCCIVLYCNVTAVIVKIPALPMKLYTGTPAAGGTEHPKPQQSWGAPQHTGREAHAHSLRDRPRCPVLPGLGLCKGTGDLAHSASRPVPEECAGLQVVSLLSKCWHRQCTIVTIGSGCVQGKIALTPSCWRKSECVWTCSWAMWHGRFIFKICTFFHPATPLFVVSSRGGT